MPIRTDLYAASSEALSSIELAVSLAMPKSPSTMEVRGPGASSAPAAGLSAEGSEAASEEGAEETGGAASESEEASDSGKGSAGCSRITLSGVGSGTGTAASGSAVGVWTSVFSGGCAAELLELSADSCPPSTEAARARASFTEFSSGFMMYSFCPCAE